MATPVQSHLDNFVVDISLGLLPSLGFVLNFSDVLIVTELTESAITVATTGSETVGSNGTKLVRLGETADDSELGNRTKQVKDHFFGAEVHPSSVKILAVDIAGGDTYSSIAVLLRDRTESFHAVIVSSNDEAIIAGVASAFNQSGMSHPIYAGLDDTDAVGDGGDPEGPNGIPDAADDPAVGIPTLNALSDDLKEQIYLTYHDENGKTPGLTTGAADFAEVAALYAATDWDNLAAGGNLVLVKTLPMGPIPGGEATKTALDENNINHALPSFGTSTYMDAGVTLSGRPIYHVYTRDWLENRLQLAIAEVKTSWAKRRLKLPMDSTGQALVLAAINKVIDNGQRAKHLLSPAEADFLGKSPLPFVTAEDITQLDITNRELRFSVLQYFLEDARKITINAFVTS